MQTIHFRLEYLRWGANRAVTFKRSDLPRLKRMARTARQRQRKLLELTQEPKATPHKGCIYCPLLLDGCPMDRVNPYARLSAKQRLRLQIYLDAARDTNLNFLKEWAERRLLVRDENGVNYSGSFVPKSRTSYALDSTLPIINAWDEDHPDDKLRPLLSVGASELNSLAKAKKKRPELAATLSSVATVTPYSEFQITCDKSSKHIWIPGPPSAAAAADGWRPVAVCSSFTDSFSCSYSRHTVPKKNGNRQSSCAFPFS